MGESIEITYVAKIGYQGDVRRSEVRHFLHIKDKDSARHLEHVLRRANMSDKVRACSSRTSNLLFSRGTGRDMACAEPIGSSTTKACSQSVVVYTEDDCKGGSIRVQMPYNQATCEKSHGTWQSIADSCTVKAGMDPAGCKVGVATVGKSYKSMNGRGQCLEGNPCTATEKMKGSAQALQMVNALWSAHANRVGISTQQVLSKATASTDQKQFVVPAPPVADGKKKKALSFPEMIGIGVGVLLVLGVLMFAMHHSHRGRHLGSDYHPGARTVVEVNIPMDRNRRGGGPGPRK